MTSGQLRNKMRRLRENKEEELEESGELNLVPYLDIVTNIVIFLLASVTTYQLALSNVNVSSPTFGVGGGTEGPPPLNLTVTVTQNGFSVAASGAVLLGPDGNLPTIKKEVSDKELPWEKLTAKAREIKDQYAEEHTVTLGANPDVSYETVVKTMDALRQDAKGKLLFPDVSLSAGVTTE
jgi:biopolymer transport protein TolR